MARLVATLTGALTLAACALLANPDRIQIGTPLPSVIEQLGHPSARYPAQDHALERLQYSRQPAEREVYDLDFDGDGRLVRAEQVLNEGLFAQRIQPDHWTRDDVLREYGPPAKVIAVHNFDGDIWVWRYLNGPFWRLLYIDIDPTGVVRGWSLGDEERPEWPGFGW